MKPRNSHLIAVAFGAALAFAIPLAARAVSAYDTGDSFLEASDEEYRHGYIAGSVDMLAVLEDADLLGGGVFSQQTGRMIACLKDKTIDDVQAMYERRLKRQPDKRSNAAASSIYFAIKEGCGL